MMATGKGMRREQARPRMIHLTTFVAGLIRIEATLSRLGGAFRRLGGPAAPRRTMNG
jgi:hypothetical protein